MSKIFTGERYVPGIEDSEIEIEHYQRYESIADLVRDKIVVDAACGEGYGTEIISKNAQKVIGIDINEGAVNRAKTQYARSNIEFIKASIEKLPLENNSVEVFVSFETIEHVTEEIQINFINEVYRVLKSDGILIISTPNKEVYSDFFKYSNEFHLKEFYKNEFVELLKKRFSSVNIFNQYIEVASVIDNNENFSNYSFYNKNRDKYTADGKYFIAIATNAKSNTGVIQSVYLNREVTYRNLVARVIELQKEVEERNKHIVFLDKEVAIKNNQIAIKNNQIAIKNNQIAIKNNQITIKNNQIEKLIEENKTIKNKDVHIRNLEAMLSNQIKYVKFAKPFFVVIEPCYKLLCTIKHKMIKIVHLIRKQNFIYKKLTIPKSENPKISIIIPAYNQFSYTYNCINSIINNSSEVEYEVILADDVSNDKTRRINKIVKNIIVSRNSNNLGFLLNCNNATKCAKGKYILFLNNDTQVKYNWLKPLIDLIESDKKIGLVGSKLLYSDGTLQEAGGIIWKDGSGWNYGRGDDPEKPEYNYVRETDYISGASIMIAKKLWDEIGGFDKLYVPAYCEDSDLAFEVRKRGYKVMYQPLSEVIHYEGISNGTELNSGLKKYQVENTEKFKEKWADELLLQCEPGKEAFKARERLGNKPVILMIDHYVPTYDKDAGSRTIYQYIKLFIKKGFIVKFVGDNFNNEEPYTKDLQQLGVEVLFGSHYEENIFTWINDNKRYINIAYLNRPHITEKYIDFIKENTNIKTIYYGHDLHFIRIKGEAELNQDANLMDQAKFWKEKELAIMKKADVSYYPSINEINSIKNINNSINVKDISAYIFEDFKSNGFYGHNDREGILFVGGFAHTPNIDAIEWFVNNIFNEIRKKCNINLYIVGSNAPQEILNLEGDGVIIKGFVSDEELESLYEKCKIAVIPLRYGAGVKGKVVEAMHAGIPIITTDIGAEGIPEIENAAVVVNEEIEFANKVCELYENQEELIQMSNRGLNVVKKYYCIDAVWDKIKSDLLV